MPAHISVVKNMVEDLLCSVQVVKDHLLEDQLLKSLTIPLKILGNEVSIYVSSISWFFKVYRDLTVLGKNYLGEKI